MLCGPLATTTTIGRRGDHCGRREEVTNVYVNLALDEMTIDMFAEKLVEKYPNDEARRKNVIDDVRAKVRAWKQNGGFPPKLSDAWNSL